MKSIEGSLSALTPEHAETFLTVYRMLIDDLPELADAWPEMDDEEKSLTRAFHESDWVHRRELGLMYRQSRLSADQIDGLARLDRALLARADMAWSVFGVTLRNLFAWGTPLELSDEPIRLEVRPATLRAWAETENVPAVAA